MSQQKKKTCCRQHQPSIQTLKHHPLSRRKHGVGGREREKKDLSCHKVSVRQRKRLLTSYVNINRNAVVNAYQLHPMLCFWITDWHFIQRQPTEWTHCHPTSSLKQCIMSPVKPLQCRSVTTHLFSQYSLASLSDCSLSSHNPALSHQQRCLTDAMDFFSGYTPT